MILKEKKNPEKILMDGVLDVNPKQENMPSTDGKASPRSHSIWFSSSHPVCAGLLGPLTKAPCSSVRLWQSCELQSTEGSFDLTGCPEVLCSLPPKTRLSKASFPP